MPNKTLVVIARSNLLPSGEPESGQYFNASQRGSILPCTKSEDELAQMRSRIIREGFLSVITLADAPTAVATICGMTISHMVATAAVQCSVAISN